MGIVRHYATLVLFFAGLLFGIQAPSFIDQYENRIDAHLDESKSILAEYVLAADSIHSSVGHGAAGEGETYFGNPVKTDYQALRIAHNRLQRYEIEKGALEGPFIAKAIHILFYADDTVLEKTIQNYTASISLTMSAILSGLVGGLVFCSIFEVISSSCFTILRRNRERRARQIEKKLSE